MSKERTDSVRPNREHEQGNADLCIEFTLSDRNAVAGNGLFEVIVEVLIRIEFRAVSGQIEHFDVFFVLFEPPFDEFGVMDPEVVLRLSTMRMILRFRCLMSCLRKRM